MKDSKKHMPDIETYAIGNADELQVDYLGGTHTIHFDMKQIIENDYIRYYIEDFGHGVYFDTKEVSDPKDGRKVTKVFVDDIDKRTKEDIRAFIVPDYLTKYGMFKNLTDYELLYH